MPRLEGKVAVVTGGAQGIGAAFAHGLAREGARIAVSDIAEDLARGVASEIEAAGGEAFAVRVDVASPESSDAMARATLERFGRIDILVTCAAIYAKLERRAFLDMSPEEWDLVLRVNLTGAANSCRAVLPAMKEQGSGAIVNMGSVNSFLAPEGRAHYSAAKAALENLTRTLAREMGPSGIRVNALAPGLVRSSDQTIVSEERYQRQAQERALRREMTPDDLIGPLVFLCSDDAAMVTGHVLIVDGGQTYK